RLGGAHDGAVRTALGPRPRGKRPRASERAGRRACDPVARGAGDAPAASLAGPELLRAELEERSQLDRAAEGVGDERTAIPRQDRQRLTLNLGDGPGPIGEPLRVAGCDPGEI